MEIQKNDIVALRGDLTVAEIRKGEGVIADLLIFLGKGGHKVKHIEEDKFLKFRNSDMLWDKDWFTIIEKVPETLYFDTRKSCYFVGKPKVAHMAGNFNDIPISSHGKTRESLSKSTPIEWFTKERPEPLEIIGGVIK